MVGVGGVEPPALPLSGARSNRLSYTPRLIRGEIGDDGRAFNPALRNCMQQAAAPSSFGHFGRDGRIRTCALLLPKQSR